MAIDFKNHSSFLLKTITHYYVFNNRVIFTESPVCACVCMRVCVYVRACMCVCLHICNIHIIIPTVTVYEVFEGLVFHDRQG